MTRNASESSVLDFVFEAAGVLGLIATLMLCMLAFAGVWGVIYWAVAAVAAAGSLAYVVHHVVGRLLGPAATAWRQTVIAVMVPALALVVTVLLSGQRAGLFSLPVGHREVKSQRHVITVKKQADGNVVTHTTRADDAN